MNTLSLPVVGSLLLVAAVGCQCTCLEDFSGDVVDFANQLEPDLDPLYHPELVPRKIGHPDWCRCPVNRFFCRRQCGYVNSRGEWVPYVYPDDPDGAEIAAPTAPPSQNGRAADEALGCPTCAPTGEGESPAMPQPHR